MAAVYVAFGADDPAAVVRQVTVSADAVQAANSATSSISDIYKRTYKSVVEITVSSAADASPLGGGGRSRRKDPASSTTTRAM